MPWLHIPCTLVQFVHSWAPAGRILSKGVLTIFLENFQLLTF